MASTLPVDEDEFKAALRRARSEGVGVCDDAAALAAFCDGPMLLTGVGAVSARLVWEGARKRGLSMTALAALCVSDVRAVHELMWVE